jgi:hypothetical protein
MTRETSYKILIWGGVTIFIISLYIHFLNKENKKLKQENLLLRSGGKLPEAK